jgi:plastocyanin
MNRASFLIAALCLGLLGACTDYVGPADPNGGGGIIGGGSVTGGGGTVAVSQQVTVSDGFYSPASLSVAVGDTVEWIWSGSFGHSVTFSDGKDSGLKTSGTYLRSFTAAGTYTYHSSAAADSLMTGEVVVQ